MSDRPPRQQIQIPNQIVQQMLGQRAEKPASVVEVICGNGKRCSFNLDDVTRIDEDDQPGHCLVKLRDEEDLLSVALSYDEFLLKANVTPKQLYIPESGTGD